MKIYRPLWEDGAFLAPQQFQQQARWEAYVADTVARMTLAHPWGVLCAEFDEGALALSRLNATRLAVRFADGTLIDTRLADNLPPACDLSAVGETCVEVVLALPLMNANGGNLDDGHDSARPRRWQSERVTVQELAGQPPGPKAQAQRHLRADSQRLDEWLRRGEPLRYGLGLYQGMRLIPPLEAAISDWAPPLPPAPVKTLAAAPQTVRLDSLSLFDTGQWALKPGSTKVLVNALVGIRAKPGWLIVVAGHTDDVGDERDNQQLSLKRAQAVRDWMRDTGDVPERCFAVQGYGESRPVASNATAEGRALNRRVEIRLVPQADACQAPDIPLLPSQDERGN
ncbi:type VI secretion system baseplate subunit TssK [Cronobacter dublinensis]|nr:type VI secretion system baseplate subunit TssK [Cronobacter dublinensis]